LPDQPPDPNETVMMTVTLDASKASIDAAATQLGVPLKNMDHSFGVVPIDPDAGLYAVKVARHAAPPGQAQGTFRGPFSNPRIAPFGLTKKDMTRP
jgi:hypothetical protein